MLFQMNICILDSSPGLIAMTLPSMTAIAPRVAPATKSLCTYTNHINLLDACMICRHLTESAKAHKCVVCPILQISCSNFFLVFRIRYISFLADLGFGLVYLIWVNGIIVCIFQIYEYELKGKLRFQFVYGMLNILKDFLVWDTNFE